MVDIVLGDGRAPPTSTSLGWFYPHDGMYARKWPLPVWVHVLCVPDHTHTFMKGKDAQNGRPGKVVFLYLRTLTAVNHCNSVISLSIYTVACVTTLQRQCPKNCKQMFPEMKLRGLVPNSYIHVSVSEIGGPIVHREYINRSQKHECRNLKRGRAV